MAHFWKWYDRAARVDFAHTLWRLASDAWTLLLSALGGIAMLPIGAFNYEWSAATVILASLATAVLVLALVVLARLLIGGTPRPKPSNEPKYISLREAATRAYEATRGKGAGLAAESFGNSPEEILQYFCYALTTKSRSDMARQTASLFGTRAPARTIDKIEVDGPTAEFRFENGEPVFFDRRRETTYRNLQVLESELLANIEEIKSWSAKSE